MSPLCSSFMQMWARWSQNNWTPERFIYRCKFELKAFCWLRMLCRVHHQEYGLAVKLMYIIHVVHLVKTHNLMLLLLLLSQTHLTNKRTKHSHIVYGDTMQLVLTN